MVEVRKANKIIKIPEEQVEKYLLDGYKKIDKKGNYIKEETKESKENTELKAKVKELEEENKKLLSDNEVLIKENTGLKAKVK
ncbi:MAG: hypothetical protein HFJ26_08640 [Clostridia bacterium]|nr:hypothetical protein [Clostridia bacterium]